MHLSHRGERISGYYDEGSVYSEAFAITHLSHAGEFHRALTTTVPFEGVTSSGGGPVSYEAREQSGYYGAGSV